MEITFQGKVAVVTGAASGIGKAIATAFAENGASVVLVDVNKQKGRELAQALTEKNYTARFFCADVSDQVQTDAMAQFAHETYQRIDILVNNAGVEFNDDGNLVEMPRD